MDIIVRRVLPVIFFLLFVLHGTTVIAETPSFLYGGAGKFIPSSPFYILDTIWDKIRMWLTLNPADKAKLHVGLAEERLAEVKVLLVDKGTQEGVKRALEDYQENLASLEEILDEIEVTSPVVMDVISGALNEQKNEFARLRDQLPEDIEYVLSPAEGALQKQLNRIRP